MSNNKQKLLNYLKSRDMMFLATSTNSNPSVCTVYYGVDDDFNFYIVTSPATEHGKNIDINHQIACVITDTDQPLGKTKHKIGLQIKGTASQITNPKQMKKALSVWSKFDDKLANEFMANITKNTWDAKVYIIKPKEIKWLNEELYGEEGKELFLF